MKKTPITENTLTALRMRFADFAIENVLLYADDLGYTHSAIDIIYHYTDLKTLIDIVDGQSLWATNIHFLNDKTEFKHGVNLITKLINEISTEQNKNVLNEILVEIDRIYTTDRFVCCFSKNGDLLSQWREYGDKCKGVSIGFDLRELNSCLEPHASGKHILYDEIKQESVIKYYLEKGALFFNEQKDFFDWGDYRFEQVAAVTIIFFLESLISDYKNATFSQELEYRLEYFVQDFFKESNMREVKFRASNSKIIPYMELKNSYQYYQEKYQDSGVMPTILTKQLPIKEIILGPLVDLDVVQNGLQLLFAKYSYKDVPIRKSKIPYRE